MHIQLTQLKILAFGCWLSSQKNSIVDIELGCKDASRFEDKDTRHVVDLCIVDLTYFLHGFQICFLYFTHISYIDASLLTPNM